MTRTTARTVAGTAALAVALAGGGIAYAASTGGEDDSEPDVAVTGEALEQAGAAALAHTGEGSVTDSEVGDEEGYYEVEVTLDDGQEVDVHLDESFAVLGSEEEDDDEDDDEANEDDEAEEDEQVTGPARDDAAAAALEATGGGTVTEVEVADEGDDGYEVEVQKADGSFVEIALDSSLTVVSVENDDD